MKVKSQTNKFGDLLKKHGITKLYHFTDRDNIKSIIDNGGLYSWNDCEDKGINISKPGGSSSSRSLDSRDGLQYYVRASFVKQHPMMYVAMKDGRISNPVILEIDPEVIFFEDTWYSDRNATKNGALKGKSYEDFARIHFDALKKEKHFDLPEDEQKFFQAEVLVKNCIPLKYIKNIGNFGIPIPAKPEKIQVKNAYTSQITRATPTAFIFLVDHSVSMISKTKMNGQSMPMSEAVARIVNNQINELVLRCIKTNEVRHYYDIAVIGYGSEMYSGWDGPLKGRWFVSPQELKDNPARKITMREEKRTRRGMVVKEVEKVQWMEPRCDGSWTCVHKAMKKAGELLDEWMKEHQEKDCYPPTIINITDGVFNGTSRENILQLANELKSMFTNDGNVLLWNIHITSEGGESVLLPISRNELGGNSYSEQLYEMSSLLPLRYNDPISNLRHDNDTSARHVAMSTNTDMSTLIQLMDIGTPTNINQNK